MELAHILESCRAGDELAWEMLPARPFCVDFSHVTVITAEDYRDGRHRRTRGDADCYEDR